MDYLHRRNGGVVDVLEGYSREVAAQLNGMDRQTLPVGPVRLMVGAAL